MTYRDSSVEWVLSATKHFYGHAIIAAGGVGNRVTTKPNVRSLEKTCRRGARPMPPIGVVSADLASNYTLELQRVQEPWALASLPAAFWVIMQEL